MFRAVVFDFDGTLVDSNDAKRRGFEEVVRDDPGGPALMSQVLASVQGDRHEIFAAYGRLSGRPADPQALVRAYGELVDARVAAAREIPGATALLRHLREAGLRVVLSSATPLPSLRTILAARGWLPLFDQVSGSPATKVATLRGILRLRGWQPSDLAVVGDGADDRASAADIGCAFFPVGEARGAVPGEVAHDLSSLPELLVPQAALSRS